jgi:hypothetical protein
MQPVVLSPSAVVDGREKCIELEIKKNKLY